MQLQDIMKAQEEFDRRHSGRSEFFVEIDDAKVERLEHLIVCMAGELGELANLAKKAARGDFSLSDVRRDISEEVTDMFIYVIKLCNEMNIDLETEYHRKMQRNQDRFRRYER